MSEKVLSLFESEPVVVHEAPAPPPAPKARSVWKKRALNEEAMAKGVEVPFPEELPKPDRWRVTETKAVMYNGRRIVLHKGKVINSLGYSIEELRKAGAVMEKIEPARS
jgi:hypothetical protein